MKTYKIKCRIVLEYEAEIEADGEGVAKWEAMQECRAHGEMTDHEETIVESGR